MLNLSTKVSWKSAILVFLVLSLISAALLYPSFRQFRAAQLAKAAEDLLEMPETSLAAWEKAQAARNLAPQDVAIARIAARSYMVIDPRGAVPEWRRVIRLSEGAAEDRFALAELLFVIEDWDALAKEMALLLQEESHDGLATVLKTRALLARGRDADALKFLEERMAGGLDDPHARLFFADLALLFDTPEVRRKGKRVLLDLADSTDSPGLEALRRLARLENYDLAEIYSLIDGLEAHPSAQREDRLLAASLKLRHELEPATAIISAVVESYDLANIGDLLEFGRWLNQQRQFEKTLEFLPLETALRRQDAFAIHIDALASLGRWRDLEAILGQPRVPIPDFLKAFYRMRIFLELGQDRRAAIELDRALLLAEGDPLKVYYLAERLALINRDGPLLETVVRRMVSIDALQERGYQRLLAIGENSGEGELVWEALREMYRASPKNPMVKSDYLYIGFLLDELGTEHLSQAAELVEASPEVLAYRMTYFTGLLKMGELDAALSLVDGLPVDWREVRPRWQMLVAVALQERGFLRDARMLLGDVDRDQLLKEERRWLEAVGL